MNVPLCCAAMLGGGLGLMVLAALSHRRPSAPDPEPEPDTDARLEPAPTG
jgi:hypothetical protein